MILTPGERRDLAKGLVFLSPWLVGVVVFTALPIALSVYYGMCDYSLVQPPVFTGTENVRALYHDPVFWKSIRNTLYYAAVALPAGLVLALALALLLNVKVRGQSVYRTLVFLPSLVPAVTSAMLWLWMLQPSLGLVNVVLQKVGITNPPGWLSSPSWTKPALIMMSLWGVGNTVVIFLAGLQDVPRELYEAAELDGAGHVGQLFNVTLPVLSPVIFFNLVMALIGVFQIFGAPYIMMPSGQPARSAYFYTMYLYDNAFAYLKMGTASAMAWVQFLIVLALTGFAFWTSKRWVHYQGK
jgi:multiple sugar transport system permease protein